MVTQYKFKSKVTKVEELKEKFNWRKTRYDGETRTEYDEKSKGFFITLEGSRESLFIGEEEPSLRIGQEVLVTISPI